MHIQHVIEQIAASAAGERTAWTLLHSLWQFAAVAAVAAGALRVSTPASAHTRYRMLTGALAAMVAIPVATWLWLPLPAENALAPREPGGPAAAPTLQDSGPWRESPPPVGASGRFEAATPARTAAAEAADGGKAARPKPAGATGRIRPWLGWIVVAWATGAVAFGLRPLVGWLAWQRLTRVGVAPVPRAIAIVAMRASRAAGLRRPVTVLASSLVLVPAVAGLLRPVILLPVALLTAMPMPQLEAILVHELVHVRRNDFLVNVLQMAIEALGFYHPAVWWVSRKIREMREHVCDDLVLAAGKSRLEYGRALVAVEELRARRPAFALGADDGRLLARIRRIARIEPEPCRAAARPFSNVAVAGCVAASLVLLPAGAVLRSCAVAPETAAAALPDLLAVRELAEEQAWRIVLEQARKPPLEGATLEEKLAALAAKGATADDIAAVRAIAREHGGEPSMTQTWHALEPALYPHGVPASIQRAANQFRGFLFLPALSTVSPEVAAALADHAGQLHLPGLTTLSPEAAEMFTGFTANAVRLLDISGLTTLSVETARTLAQTGCETIALPAVPLSPEVVEVFGGFSGGLSFPTLGSLTPQAASLLVAKPGTSGLLMLRSVRSLPAESAVVLAGFASADNPGGSGWGVDLGGLAEISPEAAEALARCSGPLVLSGLRELSPEVARGLAQATGFLDLSGLREVSAEVAEAFEDCPASLRLSGVERLSADAAESLARVGGMLDLSGLVSLTPEIAGKLAALPVRFGGLALNGLAELQPAVAEQLAKHVGPLSLGGVRRLAPDVARVMVAHAGALDLSGLTELTPETAEVLATFDGDLAIGIPELTPDVAAVLARHRKTLFFPALKTVALETARALGDRRGRLVMPAATTALSPEVRKLLGLATHDLPHPVGLSGGTMLTVEEAEEAVKAAKPLLLDGLVELSPQAAAILAAGFERLPLGSLETISPEVAAALATCTGHLVLGVMTLSQEVATALAEGGAWLEFSRLAELSPETARALGGRGGWLSLPAVTNPPADVAATLVTCPQPLELSGLETLSPQAAAALAKADARAELRLYGLRTLSPAAATALASSKAFLSLGLTTLSPDVATALAACPGTLGLDSVRWLSPAAAAAIGRRRGDLVLGLRTLSPGVARGLARCRGPLYLDGVKSLSVAAARELAGSKDFVALRGIRNLPPEVAEILSHGQTRGNWQIDLAGLTTLPPEATAALLEAEPGRLSLGGLARSTSTVTPDLARLLVRSAQRDRLRLEGVATLEGDDAVEIATILATQKGRLTLPNLERISRGALEALRANKGVELPEGVVVR